MDLFLQIMDLIFNFMRRDITVYGFTFSYFDVFMFSIVGSLVSFLVSVFLWYGSD